MIFLLHLKKCKKNKKNNFYVQKLTFNLIVNI